MKFEDETLAIEDSSLRLIQYPTLNDEKIPIGKLETFSIKTQKFSFDIYKINFQNSNKKHSASYISSQNSELKSYSKVINLPHEIFIFSEQL